MSDEALRESWDNLDMEIRASKRIEKKLVDFTSTAPVMTIVTRHDWT
jgi:hypothetical protein